LTVHPKGAQSKEKRNVDHDDVRESGGCVRVAGQPRSTPFGRPDSWLRRSDGRWGLLGHSSQPIKKASP